MPRVQLIVDVHSDGHAGSGPDGSLEWAVRVAASFAEDGIAQGAEVEVVYGGRSVAAGTGPVAARRARMLDALARLEPDGLFPLRSALEGSACRRFEGGLRVVVATDRAARTLSGKAGRERAERFLILNHVTFSYGPAGDGGEVLQVRPWVRIDDPRDVPGAVRRGWKEVSIDR